MAEDVSGSGMGQAVTKGLGGSRPDSRSYTYQNAIRVICTGNQREVRKLAAVDIYKLLCEKFGQDGEMIRSIDGIGKGVNQGEWIVSFPDGKHPDEIGVGITVQYSLGSAYLQDARKEFSEVKTKEAIKDLQFRISGLPIDVNNQELQSKLVKLGFKVDLPQLRQLYDRTTKFRSEVVLFRIRVDSEKEQELVAKAGQHTIALRGYTFKINIVCYGYCLRCKKAGHVSRDCVEREEPTCDLCKEAGQIKRTCPNRETILASRKAKTTCYVCYRKGHYSSDCDTAWIQPHQKQMNNGYVRNTVVYDENKTDEESESYSESNSVHDHPTVAASVTPRALPIEEPLARNVQLAIDLQTVMALAGSTKRGSNERTPPSDLSSNDGKLHKPSNSQDGSLHTANPWCF